MHNARIPKILLVDDEISILRALTRQLHGQFQIDCAQSGESGLEFLRHPPGYAVIVSDMHMPEMNGIEFLRRAREIAPDSVRLMLTGNHDQNLAVEAINEGHIFRFLNKPCSSEQLARALEACVEQHRLITAEHELLQSTLGGSIKLLTDILSLADPAGFGRGVHLRQLIRGLAGRLDIRNPWDMELAAMLGNIGRVVIPDAVLAKQAAGAPLSSEESKLLQSIPERGRDLLSNIPRLERVTAMVYYQDKHFDGSGFPADGISGEGIPLGARVLHLLKDVPAESTRIPLAPDVVSSLRARKGRYDPALLDLLSDSGLPHPAEQPRAAAIFEVSIAQLCPGQKILHDVLTADGRLLIAAGSLVSEMMVSRLKNYREFVGVREPISVDCMIPTAEKEHEQ